MSQYNTISGNISTHALTEGDSNLWEIPNSVIFQLTPSRRATHVEADMILVDKHFNSRPHGGRQCFGN